MYMKLQVTNTLFFILFLVIGCSFVCKSQSPLPSQLLWTTSKTTDLLANQEFVQQDSLIFTDDNLQWIQEGGKAYTFSITKREGQWSDTAPTLILTLVRGKIEGTLAVSSSTLQLTLMKEQQVTRSLRFVVNTVIAQP